MTALDVTSRWVTRKEAADILGISTTTLRRLIGAGALKVVQPDGWRINVIPRTEIERYKASFGRGDGYHRDSLQSLKIRSGVGTIYAIETASGRVKLGYTKNLKQRMASIKSHAGQATLIRAEAGTTVEEGWLHEYCAAHRISGEHFRYEGRVRDYCQGLYCANDLLREQA